MDCVNDMTARRFGSWTVLSKVFPGWLCRCDCGTERVIRTDSLKTGNRNHAIAGSRT